MKKRVLLAEDEVATRFSLSLILKKAGFDVVAVENGVDALKEIILDKTTDLEFDLFIMDIQMPHLTGVELSSIIKGKISFPIIAITGYGDMKTKEKLLFEGCSAYLEKPFSPEEFITCIDDVLNKKINQQTNV